MPRKSSNHHPRITLELPPQFVELCQANGVPPGIVLRGFIADLAGIVTWFNDPFTGGYCGNGTIPSLYARKYYECVGYPGWRKPSR